MFDEFKKTVRKSFGSNTIKLLVIGTPGAGKSSTVGNLRFKAPTVTIPTLGYSIETLNYGEATLQLCDTGLCRSQAPASFVRLACGVILVVDGTNRSLLPQARHLLEDYFELTDAKLPLILVCVNKTDLEHENVIGNAEVERILQLEIFKSAKWAVERTNAATGTGIGKGIQWIIDNV